ncbi:MAG: hypothetical protein ABEN55_01085, partial [Bradymonadaceae bacterium]
DPPVDANPPADGVGESPGTNDQQSRTTKERKIPPSKSPTLSALDGEYDKQEVVETGTAESGSDEEVFSITMSPDGSGIHLDDVLVEAPLDGAEENPAEADELRTSPNTEEADDDHVHIQKAEAEPTHLIQLDDGRVGTEPTTGESPASSTGGEIENRQASQRRSAEIPDDATGAGPEGAEDPPTTPDGLDVNNDRRGNGNGNPLPAPNGDEIPTEPAAPEVDDPANARGQRAGRKPYPREASPNRPAGDNPSNRRGGGRTDDPRQSPQSAAGRTD